MRTKLFSLFVAWSLLAALIAPGLLNAADEQPAAPEPPSADQPPADQPPANEVAPPAEQAPQPSTTEQAPAEQPTQTTPQPEQPAPAAPAPAPAPAENAVGVDDGKPEEKARAKAAADKSVTIKDFEFVPPSVTINVGDTVTWTNQGPTEHTATANGGEFDTGLLDKGDSSSHTFNKADTFSYICRPHPFMKGTIKVVASQSGGGGGGQGGGGGGAGDTGTSGQGAAGGGAAAGDTTAGGSELANTGLDSTPLAVLGALMLAAGILIRRRVRATGR
jgi:LPXTG-motif cell wall-anchored protein